MNRDRMTLREMTRELTSCLRAHETGCALGAACVCGAQRHNNRVREVVAQLNDRADREGEYCDEPEDDCPTLTAAQRNSGSL